MPRKPRATKEKGPTPQSRDEAEAILRELIRQRHPYFRSGDLLDCLFKQQKAFARDPAKKKAALCSRRAGKSRSAAVGMIKAAQNHPGSLVPYIALTRQSAQNIMWPAIEEMNRFFFLNLEMKESSLEVTVPTKGQPSKLFFVGADQKNFIDRLRGPKYPLAIIDEAAAFRTHIQSLVDDVLEPATGDYQGEIWLLGTPGPTPAGYFYEATTNKASGYSTHSWTVLDNPFFPNALSYLERIKAQNNWTDATPTYRREWLGQWARDESALVYKLKDYNLVDEFEDDQDWHYVLGIDIGWHDQTAFSVLAYSPDSPVTYVVQSEGFSHLIPSEIADYAKMMIENYEPTNIVMDTGGLGKSIAEEFKRRFHIPVEAAEKKEKMAMIELMNGDFQRNHLRIFRDNTELIDQMNRLQKADNGLEDPNLPNDYCDATLYSFRKCKQYVYQGEPYKVNRNSKEWMEEWIRQKEHKLANPDQFQSSHWDDLSN